MKHKKTFTFKLKKGRFVRLNDVAADALTHEDSLKNWLVRKAYLVKNVERCLYIHAVAAKANIPLSERLRLQKKIDADISPCLSPDGIIGIMDV